MTEDVGPVEETLETNATFLAESIAQYEEHPAQGPYTLAMGNSAIYVSLPNVTPDHEAIVSAIRAQVSNGTAASHLPHDVPASVAEGYAAQLSLLADSLSNPQHPVLEAPWMGTVPATGFLLKPLSRGSVRINASNPDAEPVIDYRTASNPVDMDIMASYIPFFRQYFSTPTMTALGAHEVAPGADVVSVEGIKEYLRGAVIGSFMHPCCTASMMPESKGGVVGPDLRVHGLGGVRVADISVVPLIPGTHTSATAYAIGEKVSFPRVVFGVWLLTRGRRLRTLLFGLGLRTRGVRGERRAARGRPATRYGWQLVLKSFLFLYIVSLDLLDVLLDVPIYMTRLDSSEPPFPRSTSRFWRAESGCSC